MLNKIAIKIENAKLGLAVRRLLCGMGVKGTSITHTQEEIDVIGLNCYLIGDNKLVVCGWDAEETPHIEKFTAQEFLDKYKPEPAIDRQELIAQLNHYQMKRIENETYTTYNKMLSREWIRLDNKLTRKINELEKQLGWEL